MAFSPKTCLFSTSTLVLLSLANTRGTNHLERVTRVKVGGLEGAPGITLMSQAKRFGIGDSRVLSRTSPTGHDPPG